MARVNLGIVVKADGTVPFDNGVPAAHKQAMLSYLANDGHEVNPIPGTPHYKIKVWPPTHECHVRPPIAKAAASAAAPTVVINKPVAAPVQPQK